MFTLVFDINNMHLAVTPNGMINIHEIEIKCLRLNIYLDKGYYLPNKGNNKITELRTILQRESQNS